MSELSKLNFNIENGEKEIYIPEGTTRIESKLFMDNQTVEKVTFPSTLEFFRGSCSFCNCSNLREVIFTEGTREIDLFEFFGCERLEYIYIPASVEKLYFGEPLISSPIQFNYAVNICIDEHNKHYKKIDNSIICTLNNSLVFANSNGELPENIRMIERYSVGVSNSTFLKIPESVLKISNYSVISNTAEDIFISGIVEETEMFPFFHCKNLKSIQAPKTSMKKFFEKTLPFAIAGFFKMKAEDIQIDTSVESEYLRYFKKNYKNLIYKNIVSEAQMTGLGITEDIPKNPQTVADLKKIWSWKTLKDGTLSLTSYKGNEKVVSVPSKIGKNSVTELEDTFFVRHWKEPTAIENARQQITKIILPEGVKKISQAFCGCKSLEEVLLPNSLVEITDSFADTNIKSINLPSKAKKLKGAFSNCQTLSSIKLPNGIKKLEDTFVGCTSLKAIEIPSSVRTLYNTFAGSGIETVHIPEGVEIIDFGSFSNCVNLQNITLPSTLLEIHPYAFELCRSIKTLQIAENNACYLKDGFVYLKDSPLLSPEANEAFTKGRVILWLEHLNYTIPKDIQILTSNFYRGSEIEEVEIPKSITCIDVRAFEECKQLRNAIIPDTIKEIRNSAFYHCESLVDIKIPDSVNVIGNTAFDYCKSLGSVTLGKNVQEIGYACFSRCTKLEYIELPSSLKKIGNKAFDECTSIKRIVIPEGVEEIEDRAFQYMTSLEEIVIPQSVKKMGEDIFLGSSIRKIYCRSVSQPETWKRGWNNSWQATVVWGYIDED